MECPSPLSFPEKDSSFITSCEKPSQAPLGEFVPFSYLLLCSSIARQLNPEELESSSHVPSAVQAPPHSAWERLHSPHRHLSGGNGTVT